MQIKRYRMNMDAGRDVWWGAQCHQQNTRKCTNSIQSAAVRAFFAGSAVAVVAAEVLANAAA